ncbi:MAG: holo-ACP synthase [Selenomonas sp.]|uniref:holo-ACP synthase n=1 Tax=Selenomonas sp. TaxID=2053611 RepID=UPI0025CD2296|nr:holo-ACP synthase [Selenomonas sp.]MCI6100191.1 holo-ACP synthase [Selenomonas sp.]MCI6232183.1 holo-ACP synthase [Selenomonas sp.]
MVLGIGTDIIEIGRVRRAIENEHFRARVYTAAERAYCEARGAGEAASFAARFAGKEAVLKAFGTGLRGGSMQDVEILDDALGCPQVTLHGHFRALADRSGVTRVLLSLSHAREYATAQCVMEGRNEKEGES